MNLVEIALSFLEGLALIVSPCILPVLPLVLSASIEGGKRRPFGIITGFVLAFTAFALLSRKLVMALDIDLDYIKYGSLILLSAFGFILLSEKLSARFSALTERFASAGANLTADAGEGFGSGIVIGMLIGLVWTPCAGPILAAVLVQVIRQESELNALFLVAAFALGAGVPMLIISLTGRSIMAKLGFFTSHAEAVRKGFGILILLAVAFIGSGVDAQSLFSKPGNNKEISANYLQDALENPYPAPDFEGINAWLNSNPLTMNELKGKVVLVDFWTYSCINCIRTLPYITMWDETYRDQGLVIIGVHAPEFEFEKNKANVEAAIQKYKIHYPIALDNELETWTNFKNRYWPAHYLINKNGQVVYTHFGEGNYTETENNIRYLLGLNKVERDEAPSAVGQGQTPETYLGFERNRNFDSPEGTAKHEVTLYTRPGELPIHHWALDGKWQMSAEHITAEEAGAGLTLHFKAKKVFLVLGTRDGRPVHADITLNGKPLGEAAGKDVQDGMLEVSEHRLYELISQSEMNEGILKIDAESPGLEAYAFTFGS